MSEPDFNSMTPPKTPSTIKSTTPSSAGTKTQSKQVSAKSGVDETPLWVSKDEASIWSSKYDHKPNKMRERMNSGPKIPGVKKTRTQAVLTALPVLMLAVGLLFNWYGERKQTHNSPILAEQQVLNGAFDRLTPKGDKSGGKHYLWLRIAERTRPIRITYEQKRTLLQTDYAPGTSLDVLAAPSVEGSKVLWFIQASTGE